MANTDLKVVITTTDGDDIEIHCLADYIENTIADQRIIDPANNDVFPVARDTWIAAVSNTMYTLANEGPIKSMKQRAIDAINNTWQAIGADVLEACGETEGSISSESMREVVVDANHLESYGDDEDAVRWFDQLDYDERQAILKEAI